MKEFRRYRFEDKSPLLLFPNIKKEINGHKFNYGGEYPFDPSLVQKLRKAMCSNGYDIFCQNRRENGTMIVWWKKRGGKND